jgi:hypothetical protein
MAFFGCKQLLLSLLAPSFEAGTRSSSSSCIPYRGKGPVLWLGQQRELLAL